MVPDCILSSALPRRLHQHTPKKPAYGRAIGRPSSSPAADTVSVANGMSESNGKIALEDPAVVASQPGLSEALDVIHSLSEDVGARRPCSDSEKAAANSLAAWLRDRDVDARIEE